MPSWLARKVGKVIFVGAVEDDTSKIRVFPEYCRGLEGLENYSHLIVLYWFHLRDNAAERRTLQVTPRRHPSAPKVGVFSSRSPSRPNPIGLSVVELIEIKECVLRVKGLDAEMGTPIIDIKPYLPRAESIPDARTPEWAQHGPTM